MLPFLVYGPVKNKFTIYKNCYVWTLKNSEEGLERWPNGYKHLLLFQRCCFDFGTVAVP